MSPSARKSVHSLFKGSAWECSWPPSHSATITAGFHSQKLWGLLSPALKFWAKERLGPLTPQGGTSAAEITLPIFNGHMQVWD